MTLTYNNNIPAANNDPSQDQPDMLTNTQSIKTFLEVNHVTFANTNYGKHNEVRLPEQGADPVPLVNEASLYCKVGSDPAETDLYYASENGGKIYQLTRVDETNQATFAVYNAGNGGWTFLPGGMILQYGKSLITGSQVTTVVTFPFTYTNEPFNIQLTKSRASGLSAAQAQVIDSTVATNGFSIRTDNMDGFYVYWMALGV